MKLGKETKRPSTACARRAALVHFEVLSRQIVEDRGFPSFL